MYMVFISKYFMRWCARRVGYVYWNATETGVLQSGMRTAEGTVMQFGSPMHGICDLDWAKMARSGMCAEGHSAG